MVKNRFSAPRFIFFAFRHKFKAEENFEHLGVLHAISMKVGPSYFLVLKPKMTAIARSMHNRSRICPSYFDLEGCLRGGGVGGWLPCRLAWRRAGFYDEVRQKIIIGTCQSSV